MPDYELRPDNWRAWPPELFDREDPAPDEQFYLEPRKVVHIDKPPFGPYPPELRETFPIGQSEIPDWEETMVVQGCEGIRRLSAANPGSLFTIFCDPEWAGIVARELPSLEVCYDKP